MDTTIMPAAASPKLADAVQSIDAVKGSGPKHWATQHEDALRELHALGKTSAECAAALNARFRTDYSRNAVIGKKLRLGLCESSKGVRATKSSLAKQAKHSPKPHAAPLPRAVRPLPFVGDDALPATIPATTDQNAFDAILSLKSGQCRWPSGGYPGHTPIVFACEAPATCGSYCTAHHRVSTGPGSRAEQMAARALAMELAR